MQKFFEVLLLQDTNTLVQKGFEISPYNAIGYGALVVVLGAVCYLLYKEIKDKEKYNRELEAYIREENKANVELMKELSNNYSKLGIDVSKIEQSLNIISKLDVKTDEMRIAISSIRDSLLNLLKK